MNDTKAMNDITSIESDNSDGELIIQNLLEDFSTQRQALLDMVTDVEKLKDDIDKLFPEKLNARYAKFFEDKVKTAVAMFNVLLDIRKELLKTTKDEIDIRRRVTGKGDLNELIDVRKLAKKIENFDSKKESLKKKKSKLKSGPKPELLMEEVVNG
jgi:hypothetical protein